MTDTDFEPRRDYIFNLGFRRGANDRDAAGLLRGKHTPSPTVIPTPAVECSSDDDLKNWTNGYKMGFAIGSSDRDLEKYKPPKP